MISLQRGYEDYQELKDIVGTIKDLNTFVALIENNKIFDITNDLRERGLIDLNFRSICATIKQDKDCLIVSSDIEVWDNNGALNFINLDIEDHVKYNITFFDDNGEVAIDCGGKYHSIGNVIYKGKKLFKTLEFDKKDCLTETDRIIVELMKLK